jgi:hypothetical protein
MFIIRNFSSQGIELRPVLERLTITEVQSSASRTSTPPPPSTVADFSPVPVRAPAGHNPFDQPQHWTSSFRAQLATVSAPRPPVPSEPPSSPDGSDDAGGHDDQPPTSQGSQQSARRAFVIESESSGDERASQARTSPRAARRSGSKRASVPFRISDESSAYDSSSSEHVSTTRTHTPPVRGRGRGRPRKRVPNMQRPPISDNNSLSSEHVATAKTRTPPRTQTPPVRARGRGRPRGSSALTSLGLPQSTPTDVLPPSPSNSSIRRNPRRSSVRWLHILFSFQFIIYVD